MRRPSVSHGMSRAYKLRSRPCPICGRKTVQPSKRYWQGGHICRWQRLHPPAPPVGLRGTEVHDPVDVITTATGIVSVESVVGGVVIQMRPIPEAINRTSRRIAIGPGEALRLAGEIVSAALVEMQRRDKIAAGGDQ